MGIVKLESFEVWRLVCLGFGPEKACSYTDRVTLELYRVRRFSFNGRGAVAQASVQAYSFFEDARENKSFLGILDFSY